MRDSYNNMVQDVGDPVADVEDVNGVGNMDRKLLFGYES